MSDKVKTIKVREASTSAMIKANTANSGAERKVKRTAATGWAQTLLFLHRAKPFTEYDASKDEDVLKEEIRDIFKNAFLDDVEAGEIEVPEKGTNARTGDTMTVCDKDGLPKWSSWEGTRNSISVCSELGKLVKAGVADQLIISETEVLAKGDAQKLKPAEPAIDTITRSIALIKQKWAQLEDDDQVAAATVLLETLYAEVVEGEEAATGTDD